MKFQWNPLKRGKIPEVPSQREVSKEQNASFLSRVAFAWLNPLMKAGYKRHLELNDIWLVPEDRAVETLHDTLKANFQKRIVAQSRYPLAWALYETFRFDFWLGGLCQLVAALLQVITPFTLRFLIAFSKKAYDATKEGLESPPIAIGMGYVLGISAMQIILSLGLSHFTYRSMLIGGQSRSALIALLLEKSLKLSMRAKAGGEPDDQARMMVPSTDGSTVAISWRADPEGWSNGRIMNLISTDATRIQQACDIFHLVWTSPVQIILTVALLLVNLGYSSLAGVAILFIGLAALTRVMKFFMRRRAAINVKTDQRVSLTQEMLQGVRFIKYFGWEGFFLSKLKPVRAQETRALRSMHITKSAIEAGSMALPIFSNMAAFIVYSVTSHDLEPATVFSSLALFNGLRTPMNWLPVAIGFIADASTSIKRMEDFLLAEETSMQNDPEPNLEHAMELQLASFTWERTTQSDDGGVEEKGVPQIKNDKRLWSKAEDEKHDESPSETEHHAQDTNHVFQLEDISLNVGHGELVAVIGNVGCGKTSLLSALAGEMRQVGGKLRFCDDRAYCPQYAWIQNATIRDNITFGKEYDATFYAKVVRACALLPDFKSLSSGDMTEIGERGITLSGGQKQRINIARAIYSNTGIVLLDDPLSAVDAHVGAHIFNEAICGLLGSRCRIMATHQIHLLSRCDKVIWMVDGRIEAVGAYQDLLETNSRFRTHMSSAGSQQTNEPESRKDETEDRDEDLSSDTDQSIEDTKEAKQLMQDDVKIVDSVPWSVYLAWVRSSGGLMGGFMNVIVILLTHCAFRAANMLTSLALSWWVSNLYGLSRGQYIVIYALLGVIQGILFFAFSIITCVVGTKASQTMSNTAMWRILRAPMAFFDTTPLGRILHRFTNDVDTMDNNLTDSIRQYIVVISSLASTFILIIVYFPYFAVALFVSGLGLLFFVSYYRSSARELKRHHATLDGAVFARFSETLVGAPCIHAYGREHQFLDVLHKTIDNMGGAYYLTFANQQWLSLRLDNIANLLSFATGLLVVTGRFSVNPSIGGLILSYSLSLVGIIQMGIKYLVQVDNSMTSTERLHQYATSTAQEAALESAANIIKPTWPEQGAVRYENVQMRYRPELPLVIDGFNLDIRGGERLGVVGRTGAGKSTILSTLFRLTELSGGRIVIDGVDIRDVGLEDLRNRLAIIPQDPTLFRGTVRSNIDPLNRHADLELWNALRQAHLDVALDDVVQEEGLNFSLGQRQLLALARAILRDARIVLVDEGTSSVDPETDALVQNTLAHDLNGKTLIAIAHRLRTVLLYDRVCVMDHGSIAELGPPLELWESGGIFRGMCDSSNITRDMFAPK